jgi:hypothetical protein
VQTAVELVEQGAKMATQAEKLVNRAGLATALVVDLVRVRAAVEAASAASAVAADLLRDSAGALAGAQLAAECLAAALVEEVEHVQEPAPAAAKRKAGGG